MCWFGAWMPQLRGRGGSDRKAARSRPPRLIDSMPHKYHAERRHHIPKVQYRVRNWRDYEAGLRRRGSLTIWPGFAVAGQTAGITLVFQRVIGGGLGACV